MTTTDRMLLVQTVIVAVTLVIVALAVAWGFS